MTSLTTISGYTGIGDLTSSIVCTCIFDGHMEAAVKNFLALYILLFHKDICSFIIHKKVRTRRDEEKHGSGEEIHSKSLLA